MPLLSLSGNRPTNLGLQKGKLAPCPTTPNCLCSQDPDPGHQIAPLTYGGSAQEGWKKLKSILAGIGSAEIVTETKEYLYTEFTSKLLGFVDDVEFYLDAKNSVIQVRSASRLGQSDLGANRARIEAIRQQLKA
ncbi:MAG: DUF1499 domain-containing protein [Acaryochloridaceae cyanobacterium SU_2_1]|nr:DUF1499 domain-containing protein [Acaryochloridaceae cyanobacterium SU_2_1]NJM95594.1 DUF1499 domain-containing protein [Acaryochloridaceae cyanobacterium CSU_5_19]